jgi:hypothetical protein
MGEANPITEFLVEDGDGCFGYLTYLTHRVICRYSIVSVLPTKVPTMMNFSVDFGLLS